MESCFGEYITKEYGLLKQILSYLKPCDLRNAKFVCSDWCTAVESLLDKNPKLLTAHENINAVLDKPIIPSLVVHTGEDKLEPGCENYPKKCKICKKVFLLCPCVISGKNTVFVSLQDKFYKLCYPTSTSTYTFWHSFTALLFPSSPKIQVSTFISEPKSSIFDEPVTDAIISRCTGGNDPIKCLLIIHKPIKKLAFGKWLNKLLSMIIERQGMTFAVGGGDIRGILCKRGYNFTEERWKIANMILITLRGEGVTAHSDILKGLSTQKIADLMQEFSRRVGPLPESASRIAFIAQCVDRTPDTVEGFESAAFKKAFPLVPQFGFRAYGEYGMRSQSSDDVETKYSSKKMKMTFNHTSTSSIVMLTFNRL